jgi:hypothetical protein
MGVSSTSGKKSPQTACGEVNARESLEVVLVAFSRKKNFSLSENLFLKYKDILGCTLVIDAFKITVPIISTLMSHANAATLKIFILNVVDFQAL